MPSHRRYFQALSTTVLILLFSLAAVAQVMTTKLLPHDGQNAFYEFGRSVAIRGNTALIGAPTGNKVYIFEREFGVWAESGELAPIQPFGSVGVAVALSQDWAAVGGFDVGYGSLVSAGAVFMYDRQSGNWDQLQRLTASDGISYARFGAAIAMEENTIVIGAPGADGASYGSGAAYVFEFDQLTGLWHESSILKPSDGAFGDSAGKTVCIQGEVIVIGAPSKSETSTKPQSGAAYVFRRTQGNWIESDKLVGDGRRLAMFGGGMMAIRGDCLLIGAPNESLGHDLDQAGVVYYYSQGPSGWEKRAKLQAQDPEAVGQFGSSGTISDAGAVIGSWYDEWVNKGSMKAWGSAYHFQLIDGTWLQLSKVMAPDNTSIGFGQSVSMWEQEVLVGTWLDSEQCNAFPTCLTGAAYVFRLGESSTQYGSCTQNRSCGNQDEHGGCTNSNGQGAVLQSCGSGSVASDDVEMESRWMPSGVPTIVIMGPRPDEIPYGDGILCVGPGDKGLFRFPGGNSGTEGVIKLGPGIVAYSHANFPSAGHVQPGDTWYFQAWYRDPNGPCGTGFNLSNGLKVEFTQ